ncbi:MAG: exodeoxyribonuclease VII small subunit [Chloroflexi bacterium]|nr:exodeoxyribonuclease VII small subunit [Chloroflexota bacterium]
MTEAATPLDGLTFEAAYAELAQIIEQLDAGDLALEESVALFERGRKLSAYCQTLLDSAELRVNQILDDGSVAPL